VDFPLVGVCSQPKQKGAHRLDAAVPALTVMPLDKALATEWPTDAHFTSYYPEGQDSWPRLNKSVLSQFRDTVGGDIFTTCFVFDWDSPGHKSLTPQSYEAMCDTLLKAADNGLALATNWTTLYSTRAGLRLIYVLDTPIPCDQSEPWMRAVVRDFAEHGIHIDPLFDWTRLMRLPRVVRDGEQTWRAATFEQVDQDLTFDHTSLVAVDMVVSRGKSIPAEDLDIPMPDPSTARELLRTRSTKTGRPILTPWAKKAKTRLRGKDCYGAFFGGEALGLPGERHTTIFRYAGQACKLLARLEGASPELIFGLFVDATFKIDPDTCERDPFETVWKAVCYCWAQEAVAMEDEEEQRREEEKGAASLQDKVLHGMRGWCDAPELHGDDELAYEWMSGHMIASSDSHFFVMTPNGYYDSLPVTKTQLASRIRTLGMGSLIQLMRQDSQTLAWVPRPIQSVIDEYATTVSAVHGKINETRGAHIENIDQPHALLIENMYHLRTDVEPVYHAEVDEWLEALGGEHAPALRRWIGLALDFLAGPICALSISGPPSIGKGLLMQGLSECVNTETYGTTSEFGAYQSSLNVSPFIYLNEGLPSGQMGVKGIADTFREFIDGSPQVVNQKYKPLRTVFNPLRVVLSANNDEIVGLLTGGRDLTPEDQHALAMRIYHIEADEKAAYYLKQKGGFLHTARPGRRWVRGPDGSKSDYILAQHFLWLYTQRPPVPEGNRLLMQGSVDAEIVRKLSTRSGMAPEIIETIISMIETSEPQNSYVAAHGSIYVTNAAVVDYHRNSFSHKTRRNLNHTSVGKTLRSLELPGSAKRGPYSVKKANGEDSPRKRWVRLNPVRLLEEAIEYGYRCNKLERLVKTGDHIRAQ